MLCSPLEIRNMVRNLVIDLDVDFLSQFGNSPIYLLQTILNVNCGQQN